MHGHLGLGDELNRLSLTLVVLDESMVRMAACGDHHTLAVTEEGTLFSWGSGSGMNASTATSTAGVLGHNDNNDRLIPTRVDPQHFDCAKIVTAAAGTFHSTAVTEDGALYTWGAAFDPEDEEDDQVPAGLGHADMLDKLIPTRVVIHHMQDARVGCCPHRLPPQHALAFAMGTHSRLGSAKAAAPYAGGSRRSKRLQDKAAGADTNTGCALVSMLDDNLVKMVVDLCRGWPEEEAGELEKVVLLMGGQDQRRGVKEASKNWMLMRVAT